MIAHKAYLLVRQNVQSELNRRLSFPTFRYFSNVDPSSTLSASVDIPNDATDLINKYAKKPQTPVSLEDLLSTGRGKYLSHTEEGGNELRMEKIRRQVAEFIHREMPIRLAHRIYDLENVPMMRDMPSVQEVKNIYIDSFLELVHHDTPDTPEKEARFAKNLNKKLDKHNGVLIAMAKGAFELRERVRKGEVIMPGGDASRDGSVKFEAMNENHQFLDRFYMSRIGMRVLAGQYICLREPPLPDWVGLIHLKTSPYDIVKQAIEDATFICNRKYGDAPAVEITGRLDLTFPYIPKHLHYILLELLKNSMRATVDWHGVDCPSFPPVRVIIADGKENEDLAIKITDEGGGIPRSDMKKIWSYLFTTADPAVQEGVVAFSGMMDHSLDSPLAGMGYGLPISRSYARYFGGDLNIMSMEGHGTDAFVHLVRLGNTKEPLPI